MPRGNAVNRPQIESCCSTASSSMIDRDVQVGRQRPRSAPTSRADPPTPPTAGVTEEVCYTVSMNAKKSKRAGATEPLSVSVDPETKRALGALAATEVGG